MAKLKDENAQIHQSKQWFAESFISIMWDKKFEAITIQEIASVAQLDRRTFYRHFSSKKDVLGYYLDSLVLPFFSQIDEVRIIN